MNYHEIKQTLEEKKHHLVDKLKDPNLLSEQKIEIQNAIDNYEYIIELTEMNHYKRGTLIEGASDNE
ncbi:membrane protein [Robertmurraya siralis]|uniref:Membrane protein n=1 Tax=Robertmurraya siralis TaxID=77777 RepID=A0A919WH24_9BACI|nr:DUF3896 family protein [Robertmurraya siralis]PAE18459.1 hypothetical protein CHH80_21675 [Bacillus sp. 7504-2]GIN61795.1 membrane protein [Robertmurraya siralis]